MSAIIEIKHLTRFEVGEDGSSIDLVAEDVSGRPVCFKFSTETLSSAFFRHSVPQRPRECFWVTEPGLPRLVRALSGDKVTLFEPGADDGSGRKIAAAYLDAIDLECDYRKH